MVITDDFADRFGGLRLQALSYWPYDEEMRKQYLVAQGARTVGFMKEGINIYGPEVISQATSSMVSGVTEESAAAFKAYFAENGQKSFCETWGAVTEDINIGLFEAWGGHKAVAEAMRYRDLMSAASAEGISFGSACGEILSYIFVLAHTHPDVKPSVNRAIYILKQRAKLEGRTIPADRHHGTMWSKWRGIAPLWAARMILQTALPSGINLDIHDDGTRASILSVTEYISAWAQKFKAVGSVAPLLSATKAIRFAAAKPVSNIQVPRLSEQQLAWAAAYTLKS